MVTPATGVLMLSVALGLGYFRVLPRQKTYLRAAWKTLPILLLALYGLLVGAPALLILALLLGAAGDGFLAFDGACAFVGGLVAFLLSHLAYAVVMAPLGVPGLMFADAWRPVAGGLILVATLAVVCLIRRQAGRLLPAILAYVAVFLLVAWMALRIPGPWVILGTAIFILSDTLLALRRFRWGPDHRFDNPAGYAVWATYYAAQLILTVTLSSDRAI